MARALLAVYVTDGIRTEVWFDDRALEQQWAQLSRRARRKVFDKKAAAAVSKVAAGVLSFEVTRQSMMAP